MEKKTCDACGGPGYYIRMSGYFLCRKCSSELCREAALRVAEARHIEELLEKEKKIGGKGI